MTVVDLQTFPAGNFEAAWVEPKLLHHSGMNVGDVMPILDGVETEFVRRSVDRARMVKKSADTQGPVRAGLLSETDDDFS